MTEAGKLDLYKVHKADYIAPKKPVFVVIEPAQYLSVEGSGRPGGEEFIESIAGLYGMAFTIKMTYKTHGRDYTVCKLEALWDIDGNKSMQAAQPDEIHYRLMIRTPEFIKNMHLAEAKKALANRGKVPRSKDVTLETLNEGECVQMLHVGPYDQEHVTFELMSGFIDKNGLRQSGSHHEIYLSDPRRVPPERLRTILRFPVKRKKVNR